MKAAVKDGERQMEDPREKRRERKSKREKA